MRKNNPIQIFILFFLAFSLGAFLVFSNLQKTFRSETDILIIGKNQAVSENVDQIVENAKNIPLSLSFYDRLSPGSFQDGNSEEVPAYSRKKEWLSRIEIERIGRSGVLKIIAKDSDQQIAENLSRKVSQDLIAVLGKYYDLKEGVDVRIIDGPISFYDKFFNWPKSLAYAFLVGLIGSTLATCALQMINFFEYVLVAKNRPVSRESFFDLSKSFEKTKEALDFSSRLPKLSNLAVFEKKSAKIDEGEILPEESAFPVAKEEEPEPTSLEPIIFESNRETPISLSKKAGAPGNLPIADMSMFKFAVDSKEEKTEELDKGEVENIPEYVVEEEISSSEEKTRDEKQPLIHEPTSEEVKERLNRLLRGEI